MGNISTRCADARLLIEVIEIENGSDELELVELSSQVCALDNYAVDLFESAAVFDGEFIDDSLS